MKVFKIGDLKINAINLNETISYISECIKNNLTGYICVTNSRTAYLSNKCKEYCSIQNNSLLTVPDGIPLVWIANNRGLNDVGKVSGKDLMDALFEISVEKSYSHYFYGCSQKTITLLQKNLMLKYPGIEIKGAHSPPFQPIEDFDIESLSNQINELRPTFFWCGLGAPKQEKLISLLQPSLKKTMSVGVGLAFEYFAGTVSRVPSQIENLGLEWLYRCFQQPIKARRFIIPFFWISKKILKSKFK
jgi:N-acetylglucosaminyldiphosphoundecaprenol N-acetyl-beta-D-mannosaminyltransferase